MGYPMTWQRLMKRNGLDDGGYDVTPQAWHRMASVIHPDYRGDVATLQAVLKDNDARVEAHNFRMRLFAGDLRRLEKDARDEQTLCAWISARTSLPCEAVALVLKEFFAL